MWQNNLPTSHDRITCHQSSVFVFICGGRITCHGVICCAVVVTATTLNKRDTMPRKKATKAKKKTTPKKVQKKATPLEGSNELLTPAQAAKMLDVSSRTLARWAVAFSKSLSETASRRGRKRFFSAYDMQQLQKASDLIQGGLTIEATADSLTIVDPAEVATTAMVLTPEVATQVGRVLDRTENMVNEVNRLRDQNIMQQAEIAELRELVNSLVTHESKPAFERLISKYRKPDTTPTENKFRITGADGFVEVPNYDSPPTVEELPVEDEDNTE